MNIPFHKPVMPKRFDKIISKSVKNGWITTGPEVREFEKIIADYTKSRYAVAVNSCTAALHLALAAKGYGSGDKFIAPTYTFVASVEVGEYLGMEPILVDCDSNYNIDLNQVNDVLKKDEKIKAIIPVHFAGEPVDMKELFSIVSSNDLFILEDAAHALESVSNAGKVGDTSDAAAFSFYANKNITTFGEGGAVTTNNGYLAEKIRQLSLHGMSKDGWKRFKTGGKWRYDVSELGYKYNMTDFAASFGKWQMLSVHKWHKKRKYIFNKYNHEFEKIQGLIIPYSNKNTVNAHHLYIIKLIPELWNINRDILINKLNENGIGTSVHYIPVHMHSYYKKKYGYKASDFPKAKQFSENVLSLPLYPSLSSSQIDYIISTFISLWNEFKK